MEDAYSIRRKSDDKRDGAEETIARADVLIKELHADDPVVVDDFSIDVKRRPGEKHWGNEERQKRRAYPK
ncbi:MAG: hypothetical protein HYS81_03130 [Candidatus Aenigmatarchaeota archaeon]|nr:MAG: hypothetical protein HYS81_03130 [Candidatus Aenigmarchaeota archaeon]